MPNMAAVSRAAAMIALTLPLLSCNENDPNQPPGDATFAQVEATFTEDCAACHRGDMPRIFTTALDSALLQQSGLVDPADPSQSLVILKPTGAVPHGGGVIPGFTAEDQQLVERWIALLPGTDLALTAIKVGGATGLAPPVIDGLGDPVWDQVPSTKYSIGGGWADARSVTMKAAYDPSYVYLQLTYTDDARSDRRQPWVKQADGSWLTLPAKSPTPDPGSTWLEYQFAGLNEEDHSRFNYEDKLAIMWNTYGPSTVAGFETSGCTVTCHDPGEGGNPGTTYNYADQNQASKKYTNAPNEIADLWHWKMVRMNQHAKVDDQYVGYWVPGTPDPAEGGRFGDAGTTGYAGNPESNGHPSYRGPSLDVPPYYILDAEKVPLNDEEAAALPAGTEIANIITSGPTGGRADIDGVGVYDAATQSWSLELRRQLVTAEATDVQFDDVGRPYAFAVAVFDNAQIEHSYMATVGKLVFQP
jgi:mono/diheme cytochrome c family protein